MGTSPPETTPRPSRLSRPFPLALFGLGCGALGVLSFAPLSIPLLLSLGQGLLWWRLLDAHPRQGFVLGYGYGLGLLGFGVSWLRISLAEFAGVGELAALLYTLGFIGLMALYYGLAGWLIARLGRGRSRALVLLLIAPAVWVLLEWLRGWLLTGFPWLISGYAWIDSPLAGFAPLLGVYGLSWLSLLPLGLLLLAPRQRDWLRWGLAGLACALPIIGWLLQPLEWSQASGAPLRVSLIQANVPQRLKWVAEEFGRTVDRHLSLTQRNWDSQLIIWPETSVPAMEHEARPFLLDPLEQDAKAHDVELLLGIPRMDLASGRYVNALMNLSGREEGYYAKRHLVPFGEYAPWPWLLGPFVASLGVELSDFSPGEAPKPLLRVLGYEAGVSICYEVAFGSELIQALPEAAFLINVSNDGWFGDSLAPYQHLEIARMRALETARYLLRATNTGISAIIGPDGGLLRHSPLLQEAAVRGELVPQQGATPYVRFGNVPVLLTLILSLLAGVLGPWALRGR